MQLFGCSITDIDRDDYLNVFSVNVSGVLFTMQAVARHMIVVAMAVK